MTWTEISSIKGEEDCTKFLESGRLVWRQCPKTVGVYEYMDTMDFKQTKEVTHETTVRKEQMAKRDDPEAADLEELDKLLDWSQDNAVSLQFDAKGKGKGKGSGNTGVLMSAGGDRMGKGKDPSPKGKGKGGGKAAGNHPLAIEDGNNDEDNEDVDSANEEQKKQAELDAAYGKCKGMQLLLTKTKTNIEELIPAFKKNPCANKHLLDSIAGNLKDLDDHTKKTKQIVVSKKAGIEYIKKALTDAAGVVKETQQWVSKIKMLSQDDVASVVSKSKRSRTM
jgi:hypothetical protein